MIDLHAHILPGLDDGASGWEEAAEMAQMAAASGIEVMAATSHSNLPGMHTSGWAQKYEKRLEEFRELLRTRRIPLKAAAGMEIFASDDVTEKLRGGELLTLNETCYVLIEFAMDVPAFYIYQIMDRLLSQDYVPVLAHPERYHCVQKVRSHVYEWYQMGAVIQINKGSVLGRFGVKVQETADSILRHRLAAVAASDAHSPFYRTPAMEQLREVLERRYGSACPWLLMEENPRRILKGEKIVWDEPVPY